MKVLVHKGNRRIQCHACGVEVVKDERYVRATAGAFHTIHLKDAHGKAIVEPTTELERSRSTIPLVTATRARSTVDTDRSRGVPVPCGKSPDELRDQVLERARQILVRLRPVTSKRERLLLGLDSYHDPDLCDLCLLSQLEAWRSDDESPEDDS